MRFVKYLFLAVLGLVLFVVALANRDIVTLRLVPDDFASILGFSGQATLPLFVVIFAALVGGILIGLVWEWIREYGYRAHGARKEREAAELKRDLNRISGARGQNREEDEVLALLNKAG